MRNMAVYVILFAIIMSSVTKGQFFFPNKQGLQNGQFQSSPPAFTPGRLHPLTGIHPSQFQPTQLTFSPGVVQPSAVSPNVRRSSWAEDIARVRAAEEQLNQKSRNFQSNVPNIQPVELNVPSIETIKSSAIPNSLNIETNNKFDKLSFRSKPANIEADNKFKLSVQSNSPEVETEKFKFPFRLNQSEISDLTKTNPEKLIQDKPKTKSSASSSITEILAKLLKTNSKQNEERKTNILARENRQHQDDISEFESKPGENFLDRLIEALIISPEDNPSVKTFNDFGEIEVFNEQDNEVEDFGTRELENPSSIFEILSGIANFDDREEVNEIFDEDDSSFDIFQSEENKNDRLPDKSVLFELRNNEDKNDNLEKSFMEEELEETESEAAVLADELALILVELEGERKEEQSKIEEVYRVIRSKLKSKSTDRLLQDEEFINSVFYRFAVMRLPLRTEDVKISENVEVTNVIHKNIATVTTETRNLLNELRQDILDEDNVDVKERARRIDQAKRQLQKLLKIVQ